MSDESKALVPLEEKQVDFYGDDVTAVLVEVDGQQQVYVPLRPLTGFLGLDWAGQIRRTRRDEVLAEVLKGVDVSSTPGGKQEMLCLPLKFLPGWLFGLDVSRVRPELKEKITRYRRECYDVLWRAFQTETLAPQPQSEALTTLAQVRDMGLAIVALAEQQMAQESRLAGHDERLDRAAEAFKAMDRRVGTMERKLAAGPITEEQAAEISARVKALAEYLASKQPGQVHYQSIFGELYRRFGVASYKAVPLDQYEAVLAFLEDWRKETSG